MNATVDKLVNYLNAYPYNGEKIKKFIRLFHFDILQIIPMNRSYTKNVQILKSITNG